MASTLYSSTSSSAKERRQRQQLTINKNFEIAKNHCLGYKRDKSSAGRIDPRAVEICALLNDNDEYYTTSSCAGRCYLYQGAGVKNANIISSTSTTTSSADTTTTTTTTTTTNPDQRSFVRFRVSHETIQHAARYFDLNTLETDPTGGGDPIRSIGQYEQPERMQREKLQHHKGGNGGGIVMEENASNKSSSLPTLTETPSGSTKISTKQSSDTLQVESATSKTPLPVQQQTSDAAAAAAAPPAPDTATNIIWLRFEPFILHVACRSLSAALALMNAARPSFKNVGLTSWTQQPDDSSSSFSSLQQKSTKFLVAIWGDEGLDMPLTTTTGTDLTASFGCEWLASLVNERHERNWSKIARFVQAVRDMPRSDDTDNMTDDMNGLAIADMDNVDDIMDNDEAAVSQHKQVIPPRSYDVIGDIAVLHTLCTTDEQERQEIGKAILKKNKAIKIVALRQSALVGTERAPGGGSNTNNNGDKKNNNNTGYAILAGPHRHPLLTTHCEYGIKCVVDLAHTFFSPRMSLERLRLCQQVARGEHVLVAFAGVAMDALQIAGRTEAATITAIECNVTAVECARRAHRMLERNKAVQCLGAAERLEIVQGDVLDICPTLPRNYYDRILAPRPKEGAKDGDLGTDGDNNGQAFLDVLLPVLKQNGGECHWYDFCADHEYPECARTRSFLQGVCHRHNLDMKVLHVAHVGSVAVRQLRVCVDFSVSPLKIE